MLKKQKKLIIIIGICALALILAYFLIINPLIAKLTAENEELPELLPGEVLGMNNRILMFEHIEQAGIKQIEVYNDHGGYTFFRGEDDEFYIKGKESAPYLKSSLSSLAVASGYTLSMKRITTECTEWEQYGLDEASDPAYYTLTTIDGTKHTVYIGNLIPTGAGYYARYAGRDAVYILEGSLETTLLASLESLIEPILCLPTSQNDYFKVSDFYIKHNGEYKVWIDYIEDNGLKDQPTSSIYKMKYPANYTPSDKYNEILEKFTYYKGSETIAVGHELFPLDNELLLEYGIDTSCPAWELHFNYSGIDNTVYFSEINKDGSRYAYSRTFNLLALIDGSSTSFLEWDLIEFVSESIYMLSINDVAKIDIISEKCTETFTLVGQDNDLKVTPKSTQNVLDETDLKNFRQVYRAYLDIKLIDYAESTDTSDLLCTLRFETDDGLVFEYKFYPYSTRRCYFTINGEGEFYVLRDSVEKAISDTVKMLNGEIVDSWAKN